MPQPIATSPPLVRTLFFICIALLCLGAMPLQARADGDRGLTPAPTRHLIVKAMGQGSTAEEAEQNALRTAYGLAAKHLAPLGGAAAVDTSPRGLRIIAARRYPDMGFASARMQVVVEIALRPMPEPPAGRQALPVLHLDIDAARVLTVTTTVPSEVLVAVEDAPGAEPELLPGGGGAAYRLVPGKPVRLPVPLNGIRVRAVACTGGLNAPAAAPTVDESFAKARAGRMRQNVSQGVLSECVEARILTPGAAPIRPRP